MYMSICMFRDQWEAFKVKQSEPKVCLVVFSTVTCRSLSFNSALCRLHENEDTLKGLFIYMSKEGAITQLYLTLHMLLLGGTLNCTQWTCAATISPTLFFFFYLKGAQFL
ncbi:hypothetical protein XENOCAPTIV_010160 [Xenoophorus captivus]|uniref:Uncharacterized protein n=1 Tax=Xenoophorus captivus TaxID=1517983 RepID=A0ABV0QR03_9TELE